MLQKGHTLLYLFMKITKVLKTTGKDLLLSVNI